MEDNSNDKSKISNITNYKQSKTLNIDSKIISLNFETKESPNNIIESLSKIRRINIIIIGIFIVEIIVDFFISFFKNNNHFLSFSYEFTENLTFQVHSFCGFFAIVLIIILLLFIIYCMICKNSFFKSFPNYSIIYGLFYPISFIIFSILIGFDICNKLINLNDINVFDLYDYFITFFAFCNTIIFSLIYIKIKKQETKNIFLVIPQNILISLLLSLCIYLDFFQIILFFHTKTDNKTNIDLIITIFILVYFSLDISFLILYKDIIFTFQSNIMEIGLIAKSEKIGEKYLLVIILIISFIGCFIYVKRYKKRVFGLQYNKNQGKEKQPVEESMIINDFTE